MQGEAECIQDWCHLLQIGWQVPGDLVSDVATCKGELRHSSTQETRDTTRLKALVREVGEEVRRGLEAMEGRPWYSNIAMARKDAGRIQREEATRRDLNL